MRTPNALGAEAVEKVLARRGWAEKAPNTRERKSEEVGFWQRQSVAKVRRQLRQ